MSAYRQSVQRGSEVHYEVSAIDKKENKSFAIQPLVFEISWNSPLPQCSQSNVSRTYNVAETTLKYWCSSCSDVACSLHRKNCHIG
jgi:hypothetical protein